MAEENVMEKETVEQPVDGMKSPEEANAAPITDQPVAENVEPDQNAANVVMILNEIDKYIGGKGEITDVPPELLPVVTHIVNIAKTLRDAYADPLFKDIMDDMVDQTEDGKTPSLLVAVARNVPMEDLQELADSENYEMIQSAVDQRVAKQTADQEAESTLYANFDTSKSEIDAYCKEMGYDESQKEELYATIAKLRDVFADGKITKKEAAEIDKMKNYDKDTAELRKSIPSEPSKEVLPDKSSMAPTMTGQQTKQPARKPDYLEAMSQAIPGTDVTQIGKRKFQKT